MGREYEKEGGGRGPQKVQKKPKEAPKRPPGGPQQAPKRPRDDVIVRAPDVHPAKREESTSGLQRSVSAVRQDGCVTQGPSHDTYLKANWKTLHCFTLQSTPLNPPPRPPPSRRPVPSQLQKPMEITDLGLWTPLGAHQGRQDSSRWLQGGPRVPQNGPKTAPDGLKRAQDCEIRFEIAPRPTQAALKDTA